MRTVQLNQQKLESIFEQITKAKVLVIGDVCVDIYWKADMRKSRLSRETPHFPLPVVAERYSPGAGGNVMNNIHALGPAQLTCISVLGDDWRGWLLRKSLAEIGIDTSHMITSSEQITPCYCKPLRMGISDVIYEDPRLDFENHHPLHGEDEDRLLDELHKNAPTADVIVVCDQFRHGVITERVREALQELSAAGKTVIVDSREQIGAYHGVIVKPNEIEAAEALEIDMADVKVCAETYEPVAQKLSARNEAPAVITLGSHGALWCKDGEVTYAPTVPAEPPIDIVGAGDTFLSAFSTALASGADGADALAFANLASGVVVKKIGMTGTADCAEIREKFLERQNG